MELYLHFPTCLYCVHVDRFTGKWFFLLKIRVEALVLMSSMFVIGCRRFGTAYQNYLQNQALDPSKLGPIDSPVSSVTNYYPTLNVCYPRCAGRIRNEGNMTFQLTITHRLQIYSSPFFHISDNYSLAPIKSLHGRSYFFHHVTTCTA
jgi:hypothetical protein